MATIPASEDIGFIVPDAPITAAELADIWSIPDGHERKCTVKIFRVVNGSKTPLLLDAFPMVDYDLKRVVNKYGPQYYIIKLAGMPGAEWRSRALKIEVSEEMALEYGWGARTAMETSRFPSATDMMAQKAVLASQKGAIDETGVLAIVDATLKRYHEDMISSLARIIPPPAPQMDLMAMLTLMDGRRSEARKEMLELMQMMGFKPQGPTAEPEPRAEEPAWLGLAKEGLRVVEPVVGALAQKLKWGDRQETVTTEKTVQKQEVKPVEIKVLLSAEALQALQGFAPQLVQLAVSRPKDEDVVAVLRENMSPAMLNELSNLNSQVQAEGVDVLGAIYGGLGTERWKGILNLLCKDSKGD